jgi:hypothetical protein
MDRFIHRENAFLYRRLLTEIKEKKDRVRYTELLRVLEAELAKDEKLPECRIDAASRDGI